MILPSTRSQKVAFFKARMAQWKANAVAIGVTPAAMTSFETLVNAADAAETAADTARVASKDATQSFYIAAGKMIEPGRDYIATIKAFAESTGNPNVYVLAGIDPPAPPTPATAPATPTNLVGSISTQGVLSLDWEAASHGASTGIVFLVHRKIGGAGNTFNLIGATFATTFIDPTFNASNGTTTYQVQAQRGGLSSGFSTALSVDLGLGGLTFTSGAANFSNGQSNAQAA